MLILHEMRPFDMSDSGNHNKSLELGRSHLLLLSHQVLCLFCFWKKSHPIKTIWPQLNIMLTAPYVQLLCKLWSNKTVEAPPHLNASNNCHRFISNITHSSYGHLMGLCRHLHSRLIISVSSKFRQQHLLHTQFINVRFSQNAFNKNIVVILVLTI